MTTCVKDVVEVAGVCGCGECRWVDDVLPGIEAVFGPVDIIENMTLADMIGTEEQ